MTSRKEPKRAPKFSQINAVVRRIRRNVPMELRTLRIWLLWRSIKGRKIPYYSDGTPRRGTLDSPEDRARLVTLEEAAEALQQLKGFDGLGIALGAVPGCNIHVSGIDLDHVVKGDSTDPRALEILSDGNCYAELSPSLTGLHVLGTGDIGHAEVRADGAGLEIYSTARYFTVTGETLNHAPLGNLADAAAIARRIFEVSTPSLISGTKATRLVALNRNIYLSRKAYGLRKEGADVAAIEEVLLAINTALCSPPLTQKEVREIARKKEKITSDVVAFAESVPTPLAREPAPGIDYPINALGSVLGDAVAALTEIAQVPIALAANSVLGVAALAAQPHANVETLGGIRPISVNLLTIAASGDRKTTADAIALTPIRLRIAALRISYSKLLHEYKTKLEAYKLRVERIREKYGNDPDALAQTLTGLFEPPPPRKPYLLCTEPTPEGLFLSLRDGQYSQGLFSDEGGTFLGSHAMSEESELRTISMLSRLWDGGTLDRVRAREGGEHIILDGRRLSLHLMMQPIVAADLLGRALFRQQGFLARCLITAPSSLAGTRMHNPNRPNSTEDSRVRVYEAAIATLLLKEPTHGAETGDGLRPPCLKLSTKAKQLLVTAYDQIEQAQGPKGTLEPIREWASKAAEHACRIAAVITLVADPSAKEVSPESMRGGIALVDFYLNEYTRLVGAFSPSPEIEVAQRLLKWLEVQRPTAVTVRRITQFGPAGTRVAEQARRALRTLADHGWVRTSDGKSYDVHPALWEGSAP